VTRAANVLGILLLLLVKLAILWLVFG